MSTPASLCSLRASKQAAPLSRRPVPTPPAVPATLARRAPLADEPPPVSVTLSAEASALVRWYMGITHHRPDDAVDGAVLGTLRLARQAYDDPCGDESFDCLLRDVLAAQDRRLAEQPGVLPRRTAELDDTASALLAGFLRENPADDPRDVVSAAVEFLLDEERLSSAEALEAATVRRRLAEGRREGR